MLTNPGAYSNSDQPIQEPQRKPRPKQNIAVEVLISTIILGLLGLLVAPRLSSAANTDKGRVLQTNLQILRTQILVYRAQHGNTSPGFPGGNEMLMPTNELFVSQMTLYTNSKGDTSSTPSAEFKYGPYLSVMLINPFERSGEVRFIDSYDMFSKEAEGPEGWVYQPITGMFAANTPETDIHGVRYFDY